ncbi:transporter substrate-binding domain-containing protein [Arcobacteraceae bacterium]|nr:transporter substrate-binding domain-containing protein [Arcobacteraceae bacterium]
MKNLLKILLLFLFLNISLFADKINLLYDVQNDGTIYPNSVWIVDMIKEAGEMNGIEVNFQGAPWSRALKLVESGLADGLINASYKKSRAKFAVYPLKDGKPDISKSLKAPRYYLYKRKDNSLDFDGKKLINNDGIIGAIKSYAVVDNLKDLNAKIAHGLSSASNLNNVLHGKYIATAELESQADVIISKNSQMKEFIVKIPIPVRQKEYYLIISKKYYNKNAQIAHKIWDGIAKLKDTKKYKNIKK